MQKQLLEHHENNQVNEEISMTDIQIFESPEFGNMRVIDQNGQEWFCAADVCRACGIDNSR